MKMIVKFNSFILLFLTCFLYNLTISNASTNLDIYESKTSTKIIYIADLNGVVQYSWVFDKDKFKDGIDFSLNILDQSPSIDIIDQYIDSNIKRQYLFFEYHGVLPTTATMKVKVSDEFRDNDKLYLYYFNDSTKKLEFVSDNIKVKNGYAEFKIKHCSDYILTGSIIEKALDNPEGMITIIIALIGFGIILVAVTLFVNSKNL